MRMSDWSADVCSSELDRRAGAAAGRAARLAVSRAAAVDAVDAGLLGAARTAASGIGSRVPARPDARCAVRGSARATCAGPGGRGLSGRAPAQFLHHLPARSAEHTSELQSLMRISYAVFCLKKKT